MEYDKAVQVLLTVDWVLYKSNNQSRIISPKTAFVCGVFASSANELVDLSEVTNSTDGAQYRLRLSLRFEGVARKISNISNILSQALQLKSLIHYHVVLSVETELRVKLLHSMTTVTSLSHCINEKSTSHIHYGVERAYETLRNCHFMSIAFQLERFEGARSSNIKM